MLNKLPSFRVRPALELWGGVECTVNRVGDKYFDQMEWSGHARRINDLHLFAELNLRTLRYPVLWEYIAPNHPEECDWRWCDERLARLQELDIAPIAGLVHHGSGPSYTNLLDPEFPHKLARFASAVAQRYPHLEYYTPVNEPLTTARFSGLYGHWYPHGTDALSWARALIHQCRGVALAMREIRRVNPNAQLVQTEDMGRTYSTPALAYQADFENERRWLSFDLLCGRVTREHPLWEYLKWVGVRENELSPLWDEPCPPDIVGINYYLTSERFLDENVERYSEEFHGGNGRHEYADICAVRVSTSGIAGAGAMLREAWERYQLPVAITEAHLGCTREEQVRWLWEVWNEAQNARSAGADVRAVTVWSLLGAYNWNTLVTQDAGCYEPGVFDLGEYNLKRNSHANAAASQCSASPRPTALAHLVRELAGKRCPNHPVLTIPGWWRQPIRYLHDSVEPHQPHPYQSSFDAPSEASTHLHLPSLGLLLSGARFFGARNTCFDRNRMQRSSQFKAPRGAQPLLITGATGTLGKAFARLCEVRHLPYQLLTREQMDIANPASVADAIKEWEPWAIINTAGYVRVDDAESDAVHCLRENTEGPEILATECAARGIQLLTFSSDLVFDGGKSTPYVESDAVAPLNFYGKSKADAEARVLAAMPSALVVRTSAFFGPWDEYNFVTVMQRVLSAGETFVAASDAIISPTYVPDLVHASLDLLVDGEQGIWHLATPGQMTWAELARRVARVAELDESRIDARPTSALELAAKRPLYSVLGSERGLLMKPFEDALDRYFSDRAHYLEAQRAKSNEAEVVAQTAAPAETTAV